MIVKYLLKDSLLDDKNKKFISSITIFIGENIKEKHIFKNIGDEYYFIIKDSSKEEIHIQYNK